MTLPPPREVLRWAIPPGDAGTEATIGAMHQLATDAGTDPHGLTGRVAAELAAGGGFYIAPAIRELLASVVTFEHDPEGLELVRTPDRMLLEVRETGGTAGDCDDIATLGAGLGIAAGLPVRYVTVAMHATGPYVHVWTELYDGGRWWELDTSRELQGIPPDWQPGRVAVWSP